MKKLMMTTAFAIALTSVGALAQPSQPADPHHPAGDASAALAAAQVTPGAGGQSGMMGAMGGPQGMMGGMPMMNMMNMMHMNMMQMMGGQAPGMGMMDHVEGRIAFLRTELKITGAQAGVWNAFAEALRTNAKKLGEAGASMMPRADTTQPQAPTLAQRLDVQERWFAAQLDGTRAIKTAFTKLNDAFSDDQKKTADELLAPTMGMGMGTMAMMMAERLGYAAADLDRIPSEAIDSFAGVGHFFHLAALKPGERVVDLGSGSGMDSSSRR